MAILPHRSQHLYGPSLRATHRAFAFSFGELRILAVSGLFRCLRMVESMYPFPPQLKHPVIGQSCRLLSASQLREWRCDRWGLCFGFCPWCSLAGSVRGPNVFVEALALAGRACRLFFHLREEAWLSFVIMPLTPRFFFHRVRVCVVLALVSGCVCVPR